MINLLMFEVIEITTFLTGVAIGFFLFMFLRKFRYTSTVSVLTELQKTMSDSKICDDIEECKELIQERMRQ